MYKRHLPPHKKGGVEPAASHRQAQLVRCGILALGSQLIQRPTDGSPDIGCLASLGTSTEQISLAAMAPCNNADVRQQWTYDSSSGHICSVSVGACIEAQSGNRGANFGAILLRPLFPSDYSPIAFDYNHTSTALSVRGNCAFLLDSGCIRPSENTPHSTYINNKDGHDCKNPFGGCQTWVIQ
jgi:hypothetical protein